MPACLACGVAVRRPCSNLHAVNTCPFMEMNRREVADLIFNAANGYFRLEFGGNKAHFHQLTERDVKLLFIHSVPAAA